MTHLYIKAGDRVLIDAEVEGWQPPPVLPPNPNPVTNYANLPRPIREALAVAAAQAFEKATGFTVRVDV